MEDMKLSAVVITFNEAQNIRRCVESLDRVADEIVVLDAFSLDHTKEICQALQVRFVQREWKGYSEAKNYANRLVRGPYIISIDADEALSPGLRKSILAAKESGFEGDAYAMNRLNNYCGRWIRHGDWYPDRKVRIFRTGSAFWQGSIHEKLILSPHARIIRLEGDLLHFAYSSTGEHSKKSLQYAFMVAREEIKRGASKNLAYHGLIKPMFHFLRSYVIKLGFLDGYYGFVLAAISAHERYMRYINYRQLRSADDASTS